MELKAVLFDMDDTLIDWSKNKTNWEEAARDHVTGVYKYVIENLMPLENEELFARQIWDRILDDWTHATRTLTAPHIGRSISEVLQEIGVSSEKIDMNALLD